jgi:hypothetical protein
LHSSIRIDQYSHSEMVLFELEWRGIKPNDFEINEQHPRLNREILLSVLKELASVQGVKSDIPNQKLAKKLAESNNTKAIDEIAANLNSNEKAIQSDCIKVLYEIGYIEPTLIAEYVNDFIKLLNSRNNRLVWGAMIALSTIAVIKSKEIYKELEAIKSAIEKGSVITVDAGIKTLSGVAASNDKYNTELFPYLIELLQNCRPKSVAQYAESISVAVTDQNMMEFKRTVNARKDILNSSQLKRIEKLLRKLT